MGFVFHYTSPEAAMNILLQRALWFTDSAYLNDSEELAYCYELYNRAWVDICREQGMPEEHIDHAITGLASPHECVSFASEVVGTHVIARCYVFCTCLNGDSPVMWADYTGDDEATGCVLVFDRDMLHRALQAITDESSRRGLCAEVLHGSVLYEECEQLELIKASIKKHLGELNKASAAANNDLDRIMNTEIARSLHWSWLEACAPFIKRPKYAGEQEYRFVLKVAQAELPQGLINLYQERVDNEWIASENDTGSSQRGRSSLSMKTRKGTTEEAIPYCEVRLGKAMDGALCGVKCRSH